MSSDSRLSVDLFGKNVNVMSQINKASEKIRRNGTEALFKIFTSLQFLAKQGIPIQSHDSVHSNFIQLLHLRSTDCPVLKDWLSRKTKWTSAQFQEEMLKIMTHADMQCSEKSWELLTIPNCMG